MKSTKYIIGVVIALAFIVLAYMSFDATKIEYSDFEKASDTQKVVQVIGSWNKDKDYKYDTDRNMFTFVMTDEESNDATVIYNGGKPNNFDIAPMVVVKGKFSGEVFEASEILTKCPSKYEGQYEELEGQALNQN